MNKHLGILGLMAALLQMGAAGISFAQSTEQKPSAATGKAQTAANKGTQTTAGKTAASSNAKTQAAASKTTAPAGEKVPKPGKGAPASVAVPDHVVYEFYFRRMVPNKNTPTQNSLAAAMLPGATLKKLEINDDQKAILQQVAADALGQAAALDAQAGELIRKAREQIAKN
jgi:hypothetical protein